MESANKPRRRILYLHQMAVKAAKERIPGQHALQADALNGRAGRLPLNTAPERSRRAPQASVASAKMCISRAMLTRRRKLIYSPVSYSCLSVSAQAATIVKDIVGAPQQEAPAKSREDPPPAGGGFQLVQRMLVLRRKKL